MTPNMDATMVYPPRDELLQAKIAEVLRREEIHKPYARNRERALILHAFDVEREGWTPPVDSDLLTALMEIEG